LPQTAGRAVGWVKLKVGMMAVLVGAGVAVSAGAAAPPQAASVSRSKMKVSSDM